jgi:D-glycero-alpha-D-manno-heptose-7-phosphate kinase
MVITRTPFRISFFGGGTDYPAWYRENGGAVLSTSIDKYCYLTCRYLPPFFDHKTRVVWSKVESVKNTEEIQHPSAREVIKFLGIDKGLEIHHDADLPARAGLGSSSAFTVGLLNALHALRGHMITKRQLALDAIHVEQDLIKENVGSQDQIAVAFGGFNVITFGGPSHIAVAPVILPQERISALQKNLLLFFTGFSRTASEIAADWIKNTPRNENELKKIRLMVDRGVEILSDPKTDLDEFGRLLHEHWMLKRGLATTVSTNGIDGIYEAARKAGAIGGKLLGAGGGGFMILYVPQEKQPAVKIALAKFLHVPFRFESLGSQIIYHTLDEDHGAPVKYS